MKPEGAGEKKNYRLVRTARAIGGYGTRKTYYRERTHKFQDGEKGSTRFTESRAKALIREWDEMYGPVYMLEVSK
jgi:hypothetical protein